MLVSACWVSVWVFVIQTEKYHLGPWWNVHTVQCYENFDLWFFSSLKHFDISSSTPIFLPSLSSQWLPWCVSQQGVWLCAVHVSQPGVFQLFYSMQSQRRVRLRSELVIYLAKRKRNYLQSHFCTAPWTYTFIADLLPPTLRIVIIYRYK